MTPTLLNGELVEVGKSPQALWVVARRPRRAFTLLICVEAGQDTTCLRHDICTSPELQKLWPQVFQTPLDAVRVLPSSVSFEGVLRSRSPAALGKTIATLVHLSSAHAPPLNQDCWRCGRNGPTRVALHGSQVLLACEACAPAPVVVDRTRLRREMALAVGLPIVLAMVTVHWWTDLLTDSWIRKVAKLVLIASPLLAWAWWRWVKSLRPRSALADTAPGAAGGVAVETPS